MAGSPGRLVRFPTLLFALSSMVLLIGNYEPDQQQSMQRFGSMMLDGLRAAGIEAEMIKPDPLFGKFHAAGSSAAKWFAYIDKYLIFSAKLKARLASQPAIVHITDHSNAIYTSHLGRIPVVVTCHDLLAVRGGLGEATDTPASRSGQLLQRWILRGLQRATAVACISSATLRDATRLLGRKSPAPQLTVIPLGLNYPYRRLTNEEANGRLAAVNGLSAQDEFILHVGSNLRRKNRYAVLRIFANCKRNWKGRLVFAGDALNDELRALAQQLGILSEVVEFVGPSNETLEALYNRANALVYPSRFEGFGWPIAEAQACGCPVVCSDCEPLPEVAGDAALMRDVGDEAGFAEDVVGLSRPEERARWSEQSLRNAERFAPQRMIERYTALYRSLGAPL